MSDLVRHLRDFASDYCTTTYHDELVRNAADAIEARDAEIERLKALLYETLQRNHPLISCMCSACQSTRKRIRAALGESE